MTIKRFILIGDWLYLEKGPEFISAPRLAVLYGLSREDCILADLTRPSTLLGLPKLPRLYPRYDGKYKLPEHLK